MFTYNDPFRGLDPWFGQTAPPRTPSAVPLDAYRRGDDVWAHLDLPGVASDSINIDIERSTLTISAERAWHQEEGDQMYYNERPQGAFRRQLHVGSGLDVDAVEADYHDGVLTLRIPLAEQAKPRKVQINTANRSNSPTIETNLVNEASE